MSSRIVLLGATGWTGALTAEALVARGARPVLAGRDPGRLAALADRLGALDTARADVTAPAAVRALLEPGDVLVTTVGPFLQLGEPALPAAVGAGAVFLASTGGPPGVRGGGRRGVPPFRRRAPVRAAGVPGVRAAGRPGDAGPGVRHGLRARQPRRRAGAAGGRRPGTPARRRLQPAGRPWPGVLPRHAPLVDRGADRAGIRLHGRPAHDADAGTTDLALRRRRTHPAGPVHRRVRAPHAAGAGPDAAR